MSSASRRRVVLLVAVVLAVVVVAVVVVAVVVIPGGSTTKTATSPTATSPPSTTTTGTTATSTQTGTGTSTQTTTPTAPAGEQIGVNVNRLFNDRAFTGAEIDAQLSALAATGATVARSDALWELAEPQPPVAGLHHYDWSFDDLIAGSLARHGLRWLAIIDYSAPWAAAIPSVLHSPPRSAADYAAFARAFAARYGRGGSFWSAHPGLAAEPVETYEIWNEPDNPVFWRSAPDPAAYADLYLGARRAISAVDPAARVIVGGLTVPARFLPAIVAARPGLPASTDGVAIHPYGRSPQAVLRRVRRARRVLESLGMGSVPLYVTEVGWTTNPTHALAWAPAAARGAYLISTLTTLAHLDCGVAATIVYTWVSPARNPGNREDWFGIHSPAGGASADAAAFARGVHDAAQPGPTVDLCGR